MPPEKQFRKYGSYLFKERQLLLYRINLFVFAILLLGALNHSCLPKTWGTKLDLFLPQLEEGYAMFAGYEPKVRTHYQYHGPLTLAQLNKIFDFQDKDNSELRRAQTDKWQATRHHFTHISKLSAGWGPFYDHARAELDWQLVPDVRRFYCRGIDKSLKSGLLVEKTTDTNTGKVGFTKVACP